MLNRPLLNRNPVPPAARSHLAIPAACRCAPEAPQTGSEGSGSIRQYWTVLAKILKIRGFGSRLRLELSIFRKCCLKHIGGHRPIHTHPWTVFPGFDPSRRKNQRFGQYFLILSNTVQRKKSRNLDLTSGIDGSDRDSSRLRRVRAGRRWHCIKIDSESPSVFPWIWSVPPPAT